MERVDFSPKRHGLEAFREGIWVMKSKFTEKMG
jgi:hypothetical protein